jgi:hypothetical protein
VRTIEPFVGEDVRAVPLISIGNFIAPGTIGVISGWGIVVSLETESFRSGVEHVKRFRSTGRRPLGR